MPRNRRGNREYQEQKALVRWTQQPKVRGRWPCLKLLFHIRNEGIKNAAEGQHYKEMGVKRGVPDLCLPVPVGGYHALYIEMKAPGGRKPREDQQWWLQELEAQGNRAAVAYGWQQAAGVIVDYLEGRDQNEKTKEAD